MKTTCRSYQCEDDFWRMRAFLRQIFALNLYRERSWHVARLEYARWHTCLNCAGVRLEQVATLWEVNGEIAAFIMPDGGLGEAHFCIHPTLRTRKLEEEMLSVAEERLAETLTDGSKRLVCWATEGDTLREELLARFGYKKEGWPEQQFRRRLVSPVTPLPPAAGYTIRELGNGLELLERCYASGLGFHEGDIHIAVENRDDPRWYRNIQTAPLYRRDLDLVAVDPHSAIAAFCTIWFDDVTRSACFEPVATVPAHQRKGLARALMTEGLQRLQRMGAQWAFVSGYSSAANALYRTVMGDDCELYEPWVKTGSDFPCTE